MLSRHRERVENKRRCLAAIAGGSTDPLDLVPPHTPKLRGFVNLLRASTAAEKTYFFLNPVMGSLMLFARLEDYPGNPREVLSLLEVETVALAAGHHAHPGQFEVLSSFTS